MMNKQRRRLCAGAAVAMALSGGTATLSAQEVFPARAIRIIVAYTAGTGGDVVTRIVADGMTAVLGQSIFVENRPGAGGIIGTEYGAKAPADGYTLTLATPGTLMVLPIINPGNVKYDSAKDFVAIGGLAKSAFVVVTANTPEAPQSFPELLTRLRQRNGDPVTFATPGVGTTTHLAAEILFKQAGIKVRNVPYRGSSQALTDVAAGEVMFGVDTVGGTLPLVKGNKLRALAVTSSDQVPSLPGVATVAQSALPDFNLAGWWGLVAPSATPPEVVRKLSDALVKALERPDVRARLASQEVQPFPLASSAFDALIRKETPMWSELAREVNVKAE